MEALLEAIFGNFMIVIIIIGAIVGFLKDKSEKGKQQKQQSEKPYRAPNPTATPSRGSYQTTSRDKPVEPARQQPHRTVTSAVSIEEQRAEQLKRLAGRIETDTKQTMEELPYKEMIGNTGKKSKPAQSHQHKDLRKQIKGNLTRNGLVDSVIMAEVLGQPRATKPYRSVIQDRRRN